MRRYDARGRLLHTPAWRRTTRDLLKDFDESERARNLREAREGWAERCTAKYTYPVRRNDDVDSNKTPGRVDQDW